MPTPPDLKSALAKLAALKAEHRPILEQIAADPGMAPETRRSLLVHLMEEEDEHVAAALGGGPATSPPPPSKVGPPPASTATGRPFTVGTLRTEPAPSLTLGTLRRP